MIAAHPWHGSLGDEVAGLLPLSRGSGQNVLYSYLSIPFLAIFGPTTVAVRAVALIFGVGLVPLLYWAGRAWYRPRVALIAFLLLAVVPWHVMLSRWGLESNLLAFFLTLGAGTIGYAVKPRAPRWLVVSNSRRGGVCPG